jgi:glucosylceramidase
MMKNFTIVVAGLIALACAKVPSGNEQAESNPVSVKDHLVKVYTTAEGTNLRLQPTDTLKFQDAIQPIEREISVFVNPSKTFQSVLGFGGALTDASAEVFAKLSPQQQDELLKAYYNTETGIGYTLARTNIASCDFSSGSYSYVQDGDKELKTFSVEHDRQFKIPLIKKATEYAGGSLSLLASPWSPPAFMKTNKSLIAGGKLVPEYYQTWADCYVKFIQEYAKEGIPVFAISVQNEPMAVQIWESCIYTAEEERDFLKTYLGPTLEKAGMGNVKIIVWDHNRDLLAQRANVIFDDPEASKYAWGIGIHWYEVWTGYPEMFDNVRRVHESYPDKNIFYTEGCVEKFDSTKINFWPNAERYGKNMINDFNNGLMAYTDWNILLDENGGPNHVGNFCFAPVHFNIKTGKLIFSPIFYYLGHFSKFVKPGAKRLNTSVSRGNLLSTSFINKDGKISTIVMNSTDSEINYKLYVGEFMAEVTIQPHAMQTLVY